LKPKDLKVAMNVMEGMQNAASKYGLDPHQAKVAGLLHNLGAPLKSAQMVEYLMPRERKLMARIPPKLFSRGYLIGPTSANLALENLDVRELAIFDAIRGHTGLIEDTNPLTRCLLIVAILFNNENDPENKRAALAKKFYFGGNLKEAEKALHGRKADDEKLSKSGRTRIRQVSKPGIF